MNKQLIIHETDIHGCGVAIYSNKLIKYSYDDSDTGNLYTAVNTLIDMGFIKVEDVKFIDGDEIYNMFMEEEEEEE